MTAALNVGNTVLMHWRVMRPGSKIGRAGALPSPAAEQSTWSCPRSVGIVPRSSTIWSAPIVFTCPSRTTFSIVRSSSSSATVTVAPWYMVGRDSLVEAQQLAAGFEPGEQVVDALGLRRRFDAARHAVDGVGHQLERLEVRAVPHPRVAGPHPPDVVGVDTVLEQPGARVGARLAAADDRVAGRRFLDVGQFVHGHASHIGVDRERRRVSRRDRRFEVAGVDDGASDLDLGRRPREGGDERDIRSLRAPGSWTSGRTAPVPTPGGARPSRGGSSRRSARRRPAGRARR